MESLSPNPVAEISDGRERVGSDILTVEERRAKYREKLKDYQRNRHMRLKDFVLGKRQHLRGLDYIPRRKRAEDTDLMCRYVNGDMYGKYNNFGIYEDKRQDGDFAYAIPTIAGHVEQAFLQLLKVKPQYTFTPDDKDDATMKLVAQMCEDLGPKELTRVMGPKTQTELYNLLWHGESTRIVGWAPNPVKPKTVTRPIYKEMEVEIPARRECAECKESVPDGNALCGECGHDQITDFPSEMAKHQEMVGEKEEELGENTIHIPHMLSVQRDMSAVEPEDSTFVIEYSYLAKHVAEWEYQSEIEPTSLPVPIEMQIRYDLERASTQIDALIGSSRLLGFGREDSYGSMASIATALNRKQPQERHYWDVSEYGQFLCEVDEPLPNGKVIPAGTLLGDYFTKGAFVLVVGDTIMDMDHCVRRRKMSEIRYGRIAGTNSGAGLKKIMPLADAENEDFNLNQTVKFTVGHPLTILDGRYVTQLPGAGNVLKANRPGLDDVRKVVAQFPGQAVNNADGAQQRIAGAMQFIAGTNTVGGGSIAGAPDMRAAGTATGIAAMQEQAAARQSGPVEERIRCDMETIIQLLENIQEFSTEEQWEVLAKRFGPDVAKAFKECNLRQSMTVGIKANTDMPRSMALTQANYIAFGQAAAQVLPVAGDYPWVLEFLSELATSMGFPISVGEGRTDRREGEYRLNILTDIERDLRQSEPDLATDAIELATQMHAALAKKCAPLIAMSDDQSDLDPEQSPSHAGAPRVLMQDHKSFQDVYKDALFSEQAKGRSEAWHLVVIQLWLDHELAAMSQKMVEAQLMSSLQQIIEPAPPPEAAPTGPTPEQQAALQQQQFAQEADMKAAEHESDRQHKDEDMQRGMVDREHATEQEMMAAEHHAGLDAAQSGQDAAAQQEQARIVAANRPKAAAK